MTLRHCVIFIVPFFLVPLIGCTAVTSKSNERTGSLLWVSNASRVDFDDLYELHREVSGPAGKVSRYEGFYDQYIEGLYKIPKNLQHGICLSPEAEWMIYFPHSTLVEIESLLGDMTSWDKPSTNDRFRKLKIELRGMIEGKWLDVLRDESRKPKWIMASGYNNLVSKPFNSKQSEITVEELDQRLKDGGPLPRMAIYKVHKDMRPDKGQKPIYFSSFDDLAKSDLITGILEGNREPVLAIMKAVLKEYKTIPKDDSRSSLKGINFSAKGDNAALVNNPQRIKLAENTPFYTTGWYALRYFTMDPPRIGMRLITERAVNEGNNCLGKEEEYILYLYDDKDEHIGEARLQLE